MLNVTTLTMLLQMQSISISRTVLLKTNLVNYLVALKPEKTSSIGNCRNVRGPGKSMVVFRLLEKLRCSHERSTKFESLYQE